jgi:hypothetical protein
VISTRRGIVDESMGMRRQTTAGGTHPGVAAPAPRSESEVAPDRRGATLVRRGFVTPVPASAGERFKNRAHP